MDTSDVKTRFFLINNKNFIQDCRQVRKKIKSSKVTINYDPKTGKLLLKNLGVSEKIIVESPHFLVRKYRLSSDWIPSIRDFLLGKPLKKPTGLITLHFNDDLHRWEVLFPEYKKTTESSFVDLHRRFSKFSKFFRDSVPIKMDRSDILMLNEYYKGKSIKEIKELLEKKGKIWESDSLRKRLTILRNEFGYPLRQKNR